MESMMVDGQDKMMGNEQNQVTVDTMKHGLNLGKVVVSQGPTADFFTPTTPFPQDIEALAIALCMTGKFAIAIAFGLIYLYTCELYPTIIR